MIIPGGQVPGTDWAHNQEERNEWRVCVLSPLPVSPSCLPSGARKRALCASGPAGSAWVWPGDSPRGSAFLALEPPWRPCNGERTHRHFLEALPPALSSGLTMERKSLSLCRKSSQVSLWAPQAELSFTCGEACLGPLLPSSPVPLSGPFLTKWVHG